MSRKAKRWRDFEILVTKIEKMLGPRGAKVKSPDRIKDRITGRSREVDASIREMKDGVDIITTLECRDYKRVKQDDRWLEQLITKKDKLGVARTIAISSTGFSESAIKTARHYNIELRRMDQITDAEIAKLWATGFSVAIQFPLVGLGKLSIAGLDGGPEPQVEPLDQIHSDPMRTPLIMIDGESAQYTAEDIFNLYIDNCPWPEREGQFEWVVEMSPPPGEGLRIITKTGTHPVAKVIFRFLVEKTDAVSNTDSVSQYCSLEGPLMDQWNGSVQAGDNEIRVSLFGRFLNEPAASGDDIPPETALSSEFIRIESGEE